MKSLVLYGFLFFLFVHLTAQAQFDPNKVCTIEDGRLVFRIDRRWTKEQFLEVMRLFDLDSLMIMNAVKGEKGVLRDSESWSVKMVNANLIEFSKSLKPAKTGLRSTGDVIILEDKWLDPSLIRFRESAKYGQNRFTLFNAFSYQKGIARFFLPGYAEAKYVNIAGTFNNWSTMGTPMIKTDSGWIVSLKLKPGKYMYKYIIEGRWYTDPYNKLVEHWDNYNSIVYCTNNYFYLPGYPDAKKVMIAGSFNNWNPDELKMVKISGGWGIMLYLKEGTHSYKFIVDENWILDPSNLDTSPDGKGNKNSFLGIGDTVIFQLTGFTNRDHFNVAGDFNGWNANELRMEKTKTGWRLPYVLGAGNYEYKFIADGKWMPDPVNPFTTGSGEFTNSVLTVKPNRTFILDQYPYAKKVIVTGNFNGWNSEKYRMIKKDGKWIFPLYLNPGKYLYKFIVDGKWITDPANTLWEENEYGTKNSVLWIEP